LHSYFRDRLSWIVVTVVCTGEHKAVALLTVVLLDSE